MVPKSRQAEIQKRLDRLTEILSDIVVQADQQSLTRCPYRNARDECTAKFGCRNQRRKIVDGNKRLICTDDGKLDYRTAWETDPEAVRQAYDAVSASRGTGRDVSHDAKSDAGRDVSPNAKRGTGRRGRD